MLAVTAVYIVFIVLCLCIVYDRLYDDITFVVPLDFELHFAQCSRIRNVFNVFFRFRKTRLYVSLTGMSKRREKDINRNWLA